MLHLFTSENDLADIFGRLHRDIFNQEKYFLDIVKVRLRLHRSKSQFGLMCSETNPNFEVKVLDAVLKIKMHTLELQVP